MTAEYESGKVKADGAYALDRVSVDEMSVGVMHLTHKEDISVTARMTMRIVKALEAVGIMGPNVDATRWTPPPPSRPPRHRQKKTLRWNDP